MKQILGLILTICIIINIVFICSADGQFKSRNAHQLLRDRLEEANKNHSIVCAVGDSITAGFDWDEFILFKYPGIIQNDMGRDGDTTLDIIGRLDMILEVKARIYLVAIGINDVRRNDKRGANNWEEFSKNITTICTALTESGAEVFVISIWPVFSNDYTLIGYQACNQIIDAYNNSLPELCNSLGVTFINATPKIRAKIGEKQIRYIPDGLHPNDRGKEIYAECVLNGDLIELQKTKR